MLSRKISAGLIILAVWFAFLNPIPSSAASLPGAAPAQPAQVAAYDLIIAMNQLRVSYGLPALIEDPIINAVAQSTAEIMAANNMSWHIGDVRGRIQAAGYGGGAQVWATENFAVGNMSIDEIMVAWADPEHMRPAVTPAYCHVGAGVAQTSDGRYYYILQAAYTASNSCGEYKSVAPESGSSSGSSGSTGVNPVSQLIMPVKIATPDAEGKIIHKVEAGQSFWAIAIAYQITIKDIETWNNLSRTTPLRTGQELFIPGLNTEGYATPTPMGMILLATPDADGVIVHSVQPYQALYTIATAYDVTVDRLLALNGWQADWPLQIGQELLISPGNVTPTPTPRPLTPIEMLTPAADGNYYHTVRSGETLSGIANYYGVNLVNLMTWNGLNNSSIIVVDQQLILQVTPPATITNTPGPPTITPTITLTPVPPTATRTERPVTPSPTLTATPQARSADDLVGWPLLVGLGVVGAMLIVFFTRRKPVDPDG
jgi:LysM repeat protein